MTCNDNNTEWTRECNRLYSFEHPQTDNLPWLRSLTARQIQCIEYAAMMPAIPPCASPNDIACVTKTRKTRAYVLNACETGAKCDEPGAKSRMDP